MFCALSQNRQHLFEKVVYPSYCKLSKELKNDIKILVNQAVFKLLDKKQSKYCFDQLLKNHQAYLNFNAVFEYLEQFVL